MIESERRIAELEDTIKQRDRRIAELREETDALNYLVSELREHAEQCVDCLRSWKETFDMVETETGAWSWGPFWEEHGSVIDDYNDLVWRWNKYLPRINGEPKNVGRPLPADACA